MSDNESVISEDIDYNSNDGSDSYHASADDYDQDNAGDSKVPERNSREVVSRPPERSKYAFNLDTEVIVVKPTISRVNSSSDNEFNDYSAEFDDASAHSNSIMYSNDFEFDGERSYNEASRRGHLNQRSITEKAPLQPIFKKSILPHHAEFVSLQAEIALEDISKEVVRLRNQQRNLLSERRNVAREKKSRAETRRAQYQVELRDMKQQLTESEGRLELQKSQTDSTQKLLDFALFAKTALESDLAVKEKELSELKFMLTEAHSKITETVSSLANERIEIKAKEEVWASKKEDFKAEILKANMLASVVQKSLDANESRLARERDRLPEEHRRLLEEQMMRNKMLEGSLLDRESSLRAEETRRFATLEKRSKEAAEDISRLKFRAEQELSEDRQKIQDQKQRIEDEQHLAEAHMARERNDFALHLMDVARRESSLVADMAHLRRSQAEFESAKSAVETTLRETAEDREEARVELRRAKRIVQEAEEQAAGVLEAEKGLRRQELEVRQMGSIAEVTQSKYFEARKLLQMEAVKLLRSQKDLGAEKFRLHSAAIELASQASSVRHTAGLIAKHGRLTGSAAASTTSTSDFNLALRATYGPSFDSTSGDALDRVEGVFDGKNFPIDRQGKKYVESLNLMSLENREDSNATTERESKSKEVNTNGDGSGNGNDASNLRNQEVESSVQTIFNSLCDGSESRRGSHGSVYDSAGTSSNAQMGKLMNIASSAEMLAEKISSTKNRRAFNTSIVIGDRSQAPYDFMSGSEDLSDEMRFERRPDKPKVSSALYEYHGEAAEGSNAYSFDSESFRDAYSGRGYSSTDSDVGEENWGPMMPRRYKQQDSAGERDLEIKSHGRNNFEDCNLRLSMDNASEQAIGLSVAAAKYGIF